MWWSGDNSITTNPVIPSLDSIICRGSFAHSHQRRLGPWFMQLMDMANDPWECHRLFKSPTSHNKCREQCSCLVMFDSKNVIDWKLLWLPSHLLLFYFLCTTMIALFTFPEKEYCFSNRRPAGINNKESFDNRLMLQTGWSLVNVEQQYSRIRWLANSWMKQSQEIHCKHNNCSDWFLFLHINKPITIHNNDLSTSLENRKHATQFLPHPLLSSSTPSPCVSNGIC